MFVQIYAEIYQLTCIHIPVHWPIEYPPVHQYWMPAPGTVTVTGVGVSFPDMLRGGCGQDQTMACGSYFKVWPYCRAWPELQLPLTAWALHSPSMSTSKLRTPMGPHVLASDLSLALSPGRCRGLELLKSPPAALSGMVGWLAVRPCPEPCKGTPIVLASGSCCPHMCGMFNQNRRCCFTQIYLMLLRLFWCSLPIYCITYASSPCVTHKTEKEKTVILVWTKAEILASLLKPLHFPVLALPWSGTFEKKEEISCPFCKMVINFCAQGRLFISCMSHFT